MTKRNTVRRPSRLRPAPLNRKRQAACASVCRKRLHRRIPPRGHVVLKGRHAVGKLFTSDGRHGMENV